jgi:hypothetical protein
LLTVLLEVVFRAIRSIRFVQSNIIFNFRVDFAKRSAISWYISLGSRENTSQSRRQVERSTINYPGLNGNTILAFPAPVLIPDGKLRNTTPCNWFRAKLDSNYECRAKAQNDYECIFQCCLQKEENDLLGQTSACIFGRSYIEIKPLTWLNIGPR